jgi:hypothetical protein
MRITNQTGRSLVPLAGACLAASLLQLAAADSPFAFREVNDSTGLELSENGKPVFVYNYGMILARGFPQAMRRSTYLHPVYAPDGTVMTDDFNHDHPHHRGIFWAWEVVEVGGKTNDVWSVRGFRQKFVRWKARETAPASARLAVENGWYDGDRKFVKEEVEVLTHPATKEQRVLDFTLNFEAVDRPVMIVGTPDQHKGYGGFAVRTAPRDGGAAKTIIRTDTGVSRQDGVLSRHPWAEIAGVFQGQEAGIRVEDDPANPGYPRNGWLMRHSFALLNVSYPGLEPVWLQPAKPLVLKYRVILFLGETAGLIREGQ